MDFRPYMHLTFSYRQLLAWDSVLGINMPVGNVAPWSMQDADVSISLPATVLVVRCISRPPLPSQAPFDFPSMTILLLVLLPMLPHPPPQLTTQIPLHLLFIGCLNCYLIPLQSKMHCAIGSVCGERVLNGAANVRTNNSRSEQRKKISSPPPSPCCRPLRYPGLRRRRVSS